MSLEAVTDCKLTCLAAMTKISQIRLSFTIDEIGDKPLVLGRATLTFAFQFLQRSEPLNEQFLANLVYSQT